MPRNGSGEFALTGADFTNGTLADADEVMAKLDDIATALTASIAKDGQTVPTAALPMGTYNHTNVGLATARTHYARASQIADGALTYGGVAGGTADALTIAPSPAITAYVIGQQFQFKVGSSANTGAATLNVNSVGAGSITWPDGTALAAGDLPANAMVLVEVQATTPVFHLQTQTRAPGTFPSATITSADAGAGAGPSLNLFRNSISPAASDVLGEVSFTGKDSGGGTDTYARVYADIVDHTAASEDGRLNIETKVAGTAALRGYVQHGLVMGNPTGADKGAGSANVEAMYVGGVVIAKPVQTDTLSSTATANFTGISASHTGYEIELINVSPATDNDDFWLRISGDGGSTYLTGSYQHSRRGIAAGTGADAGSASDAKIVIAGNIGNATGESISGTIRLIYSGTAAYNVKVTWSVTYTDTSGNIVVANGGGYYSLSVTLGGIRCMMSTGNMAAGTIKWRPILA